MKLDIKIDTKLVVIVAMAVAIVLLLRSDWKREQKVVVRGVSVTPTERFTEADLVAIPCDESVFRPVFTEEQMSELRELYSRPDLVAARQPPEETPTDGRWEWNEESPEVLQPPAEWNTATVLSEEIIGPAPRGLTAAAVLEDDGRVGIEAAINPVPFFEYDGRWSLAVEWREPITDREDRSGEIVGLFRWKPARMGRLRPYGGADVAGQSDAVLGAELVGGQRPWE